MAESFSVSDLIPASPDRIYYAWLDGTEHAAMTGGGATGDQNVGGTFTAWDGYIKGVNLELEPGRRIVQAWRSQDFPDGSADSRIELILEPAEGGTRVTLNHSEIPDGQGGDYEEGWRDHYFTPMRKYFSAAKGSANSEAPTLSMPAIAMPPAEDWEVAAEEPTRPDDVGRAARNARPKARPAAKAKPAAAPAKKKPAAPAKKQPAAKKKAPAQKKPAAQKKKAPAKKKPAAKKKAPAKKPAANKKKAPAKKKPAAKKGKR